MVEPDERAENSARLRRFYLIRSRPNPCVRQHRGQSPNPQTILGMISIRATTGIVAIMLASLCINRAAAQSPCRYGQTQAALNRCASDAASAEMVRLNKLLTQLYPELDSTRAAQLRKLQADWVRLRDAQCDWDAGSYSGGSIVPMWYANCIAASTHARIQDLRFHLCDDDAGMTGECAASRAFADSQTTGRKRR